MRPLHIVSVSASASVFPAPQSRSRVSALVFVGAASFALFLLILLADLCFPFTCLPFFLLTGDGSERLPDSGAAVIICLQLLRMNAESPDPPIRAPRGRH